MTGGVRRALAALAVAGAALPALAAETQPIPALLFRDTSPLTVLYEREHRLPGATFWSGLETALPARLCHPRAVRGEGDTCETPRPPRLLYRCEWARDTRFQYRLRARAPVPGAPIAAGVPLQLDNQEWRETPDIQIVLLPDGPWTATGGVGGAARIFPVDPSGVPVILPVLP